MLLHVVVHELPGDTESLHSPPMYVTCGPRNLTTYIPLGSDAPLEFQKYPPGIFPGLENSWKCLNLHLPLWKLWKNWLQHFIKVLCWRMFSNHTYWKWEQCSSEQSLVVLFLSRSVLDVRKWAKLFVVRNVYKPCF